MDERRTPCECLQAGYCPRHQCEKTTYQFEMCRRMESWFALYEGGRGPGQRRLRRPDCRYRGDVVRTEMCPTCSGQIQLKVFQCKLYTECTIPAKLPAVHDCASCSDFSPVEL